MVLQEGCFLIAQALGNVPALLWGKYDTVEARIQDVVLVSRLVKSLRTRKSTHVVECA